MSELWQLTASGLAAAIESALGAITPIAPR